MLAEECSTFYKPGEETGTLRVNVTTGEGPPEKLLTVDYLAESIASVSYGATPVHFGQNAILFRYDMPGKRPRSFSDDSVLGDSPGLAPEELPPCSVHVYLLADRFSDPVSIAEMELLDCEIEAAELSPRLGRMM